jgi:hypothetical protein
MAQATFDLRDHQVIIEESLRRPGRNRRMSRVADVADCALKGNEMQQGLSMATSGPRNQSLVSCRSSHLFRTQKTIRRIHPSPFCVVNTRSQDKRFDQHLRSHVSRG